MAEMPPAEGAEDLGADHPMGGITQLGDVLRGKRFVEARPTRSGVELGPRGEKRQAAARAEIDALLVVIEEVATEGGLCSFGPQDAVGLGSELFLPLGIGLHHTGKRGDLSRLAIGSDETNGNSIGGGIGSGDHGEDHERQESGDQAGEHQVNLARDHEKDRPESAPSVRIANRASPSSLAFDRRRILPDRIDPFRLPRGASLRHRHPHQRERQHRRDQRPARARQEVGLCRLPP